MIHNEQNPIKYYRNIITFGIKQGSHLSLEELVRLWRISFGKEERYTKGKKNTRIHHYAWQNQHSAESKFGEAPRMIAGILTCYIDQLHRQEGRNVSYFTTLLLKWEMEIYRIKILHPRVAEGFCNFSGCHHTCHRVAIAHWFSHGDNVWNKVFTMHLEAPEVFPDAAKAYLYFISYKHSPCFTYISEKKEAS